MWFNLYGVFALGRARTPSRRARRLAVQFTIIEAPDCTRSLFASRLNLIQHARRDASHSFVRAHVQQRAFHTRFLKVQQKAVDSSRSANDDVQLGTLLCVKGACCRRKSRLMA